MQQLLKQLTHNPGIYQMKNAEGKVIYVGKAKDLKKRVSSYFRSKHSSVKTHSMMQQVVDIEVTVTPSENEALLLESNLIKTLKPRYNILLRDDKTYPYIVLSGHDYPRLDRHRGAKKPGAQYFGPFPSVVAVNETLNILQKLFKIRTCKDSFFSHRSRPCLQYQIQRCTAPCVDLIAKAKYQDSVHLAQLFLQGKNKQILEELGTRMQQASERRDYEQAIKYRDQIINLRHVQEQQSISGDGGDTDVIAVEILHGMACVQLIYIRGGRVLGNKALFPRTPKTLAPESARIDILSAFIAQYYIDEQTHGAIPELIITSEALADKTLFEEVLSAQAQKKIRIVHKARKEKAKWLVLAKNNAQIALNHKISQHAGMRMRLRELQQFLQLDSLPKRLECFDISHLSGTKTVASCVVFDENGPKKSDYRRFNITDITPGDDYAAMQQALMRRYKRLKANQSVLPEVLVIDGGKGQLKQAEQVLAALQINDIIVLAVAKGPERKPGLETLILAYSREEFHLSANSPALHLIQHIRDEAHRFAVTGHQQRRNKAQSTSTLEDIEGIGSKKRQQILQHFGGLQALTRASVDEIAKVKGVGRKLAEIIFAYLH